MLYHITLLIAKYEEERGLSRFSWGDYPSRFTKFIHRNEEFEGPDLTPANTAFSL